MGTIRRYNRKVVTAPVSAPKMAKSAQPIMFATRSGTIVCVSNVATKKIGAARANILASVMLCRQISSRRLKMASQVTLFGSRPIWTRIFANLRLSVAASRMRSSMMDISPLKPVRPVYRKWLYRNATNLATRLPRRVKDGCGQQSDGTAGLPPASEMPVRSGTYASCQEETHALQNNRNVFAIPGKQLIKLRCWERALSDIRRECRG